LKFHQEISSVFCPHYPQYITKLLLKQSINLYRICLKRSSLTLIIKPHQINFIKVNINNQLMVTEFNESEVLENIAMKCIRNKQEEITKDLELQLAPYPKKERTISLLLEIIKGYKSPDYETMKLDKVKEEIGRYAVRIYCKDEIPSGLIKLLSEYYDSNLFNEKIDEQTYEQTLNKIRPKIYRIIGDKILAYLTLHVLNPENVHRYVMREHESQNSYNYE